MTRSEAERTAVRPKGTEGKRVATLETTLARVVLALHMHHVMPFGPSWDECPHPHCTEAKRLLPTLRLSC
jgi:hypothetical protein